MIKWQIIALLLIINKLNNQKNNWQFQTEGKHQTQCVVKQPIIFYYLFSMSTAIFCSLVWMLWSQTSAIFLGSDASAPMETCGNPSSLAGLLFDLCLLDFLVANQTVRLECTMMIVQQPWRMGTRGMCKLMTATIVKTYSVRLNCSLLINIKVNLWSMMFLHLAVLCLGTWWTDFRRHTAIITQRTQAAK